jgi:hypothetical protein
MKIIDIKLNKDTNNKLILQSQTLYPLTVTTMSFWGKIKEIEVFPTSKGPTFWSNSIHYFIFVDKLGKELPDKLSEQCTKFCHMYHQKWGRHFDKINQNEEYEKHSNQRLMTESNTYIYQILFDMINKYTNDGDLGNIVRNYFTKNHNKPKQRR